MPAFKPAYLIHGDDHGRIAERRRRLRALAEEESGTQGIEVFEGDAATPEAVANALNALTFAIGRRFIVVDGTERWTDKQLDPLEAALKDMPPDTTVAFFAREDSRTKAPKRLHDAVKKAGGDISAEESVKPWELPKWVIARARELGLQLEPDTARALIAHVGDRQQRLLRELEKLALYAGPGSPPRRRDRGRADRAVGRAQGVVARRRAPERRRGRRHEPVPDAAQPRGAAAGPPLLDEPARPNRPRGGGRARGRRVRRAGQAPAADALAGGRPADRRRTPRSGAANLERTIEELAELELSSRGGGTGGAGEDTAALLAIQRVRLATSSGSARSRSGVVATR